MQREEMAERGPGPDVCLDREKWIKALEVGIPGATQSKSASRMMHCLEEEQETEEISTFIWQQICVEEAECINVSLTHLALIGCRDLWMYKRTTLNGLQAHE